MESNWLSKTIYKNALKEGRVYLTVASQTSNGTTGYNLYILDKKTRYMKYVCGHSCYWSNTKGYYHVVAWGTSRPLEVILSVGYNLGLKFEEIRQNYRVI